MAVRLLIVAQVACVALLGAAVRGNLLPPSAHRLAEVAAVLAFYPVLIGFPLAVYFASGRAGMPTCERRMILGVEAALGFATLMAVLPMVQ